MSYQTILLDTEGRVANLTLNRPEKMNAIDETMERELVDALGLVGRDDGINVLVMTGAGQAFCSGVDLSYPVLRAEDADKPKTGAYYTKVIQKTNELFLAIHTLPQVTIAAVNGVCVGGGGFGLAMACDMRLRSGM